MNETSLFDNKSSDKTVYIIDSYGLIFRCYFAFISRPLSNSSGENISALFGFFRNLHYVIEHYKPSYIFAAMDSKTKTFRHEMYPEYKATRNKTPEDLHAQIPWIEEVLEVLGIPVLQCDGYEADDIIATVAKKCETEGRECRILSGDKDLMQLVTDRTNILKPENGGGWKICKTEGVKAEWGVEPAQLLDLLSLYGDTADNIPGVKGVGTKTAAKLLNDYKDLDGIYAHIDEIKGAMQKKLLEGKESAYFSRKLVLLNSEVPCSEIDKALSSPNSFNFSKAAEMLKKYQAFQVAKSFAECAVNAGEITGTDNGTAPQAEDSFSKESAAAGKGLSGTESSSAAKTESSSTKEASASKTASPASSASDFSVAEAETEAEEYREPVQNQGDYKAVTNLEELKAFVDSALKLKKAAFDTETTGLDPLNSEIAGFSLSVQKGKGIYVPLYSTNMFESMDFISKDDALKEVARIFSNPEMTVALHNGKFDLKVLFHAGLSFENGNGGENGKPSCQIFDTMVASWLLNPERTGKNSYSLEYVAETVLYLKGTEFSEIVPKGQTFADIEIEKAAPYAAEDADFTFQLAEVLSEKLKNKGLYQLFTELEMKVLPILFKMEVTGIHLDSKALNDYNLELTESIMESEKALYREVGHEFNIASPKQLQTILFEERGLKPSKKTKTGYSTDTDVLEELSAYDPVPRMILEYRESAKLKSTYVETLPQMCDKDMRIHTEFVQTGTATGRLSSREPNLQNIPVRSEAGRKIRSAFTAPEGKVLISADYSQIELVVLAHLSQDETMMASFINGTDVHKATAALIYGVSPEEVTPEMRRTAKTINFGVIYGMSAFRLANDLGIPRREAAAFIENYDRLYSKITQFKTETICKAEESGFVQTIFGRKRAIPNILSRNKVEKAAAERIAINTPVQGSAADIVKKAMIQVEEALTLAGDGAKLLLQVHDELIVECPDDEKVIQKTIAVIREKMENAVTLSVPLKVSVEYGKSWGLFH